MKIRKFVKLGPGFDVDLVEEIYDEFPEVDYFYCDSFLRFYGTPERLEEVLRACRSKGIPIVNS